MGIGLRIGLELNCSRADVQATQAPAHTQLPEKQRSPQRHQQHQRDKCAGHKRKRNADAAETCQDKKTRGRTDDSESEGQIRSAPSPAGMDSRSGTELSGSRADVSAALMPTQARVSADDSKNERQPRVPSPTGIGLRAGLELNCTRADVKATQAPAHTQLPQKQRSPQRHQQHQRDKCAGHKRKRSADAAEACPGKKARERTATRAEPHGH